MTYDFCETNAQTPPNVDDVSWYRMPGMCMVVVLFAEMGSLRSPSQSLSRLTPGSGKEPSELPKDRGLGPPRGSEENDLTTSGDDSL